MASIERYGLFHGDAMDLILGLEDNSVDLVVLDPDYQDWDRLCKQGLKIGRAHV